MDEKCIYDKRLVGFNKNRMVNTGIQCRMTNNSLQGEFTCVEYVTESKKQKQVIIHFL